MEQTKKLAGLIRQKQRFGKTYGGVYPEAFDISNEEIAEHLVANGVTIPVRCMNCIHFLASVDLCKQWEMVTDADGFCHRGEPRNYPKGGKARPSRLIADSERSIWE